MEAIAGYGTLLHGEAVSIGMVCAARLSQRVCGLAADDAARQQQLLDVLGLPTRLPKIDREALLAAMARDKKVEYGRLPSCWPIESVRCGWSSRSTRRTWLLLDGA